MKYYNLIIYDNDSFFLETAEEDRHKYMTCSSCQMILNKRNLIQSYLPFYKIKRRKYHLSCSYDGFNVASQKFKDLYESSNWQGLVFYPISKNNGFYLFECTAVVTINKNFPVFFEDKCNECGLYMGVYGTIPTYIDSTEIKNMNPNTFYRSDIEFGHDYEQAYLLFASEEITNILKTKGLIKNIDLKKVNPIV